MYKKVDVNLDFCQRETEVINFWDKNNIFEKSIKQNEGAKEFTFYDGPPTANGKPHIGHILTRVIKDIIPRYKTMKGMHVLRKAGWDTHGLPVELEVEKLLKMDGKQDIERYGIDEFIQQCKKSVWKYKGEWERMSSRVGFWADMENPYITYDNDYIESVWWSLKQIADQGLIYKGHKIVPYCPRCGTSLSSHEVAQGYKDVKEISVYVNLKVKEKDEYLMIWTTTPWTLPSNAAVCVNPKENYSKVLSDEKTYILAEALVEKVFEDKEYKIIETFKGSELEKIEYEPLFNTYDGDLKSHYVTCDSYVTLTDGTGVVHTAPAFGEDDARIGRKYNLPFIQVVDDRGRFTKEAGSLLFDIFVKDGDKIVIEDLQNRELMFKTLMYEHSYPFCWRCDTPLLYYARSTWFIKVTEKKDLLIKNNNSINWIPKTIKKGRMGNFLENVIDWGISRERYWGTPLPIWVCEECNKAHTIGSREELSKRTGCSRDIELHKPYIDKLTFKCDDCQGIARRVPEVIDCWYDSGSMPFAQLHYPFENKEQFEKNFPADFISEAIDQTRGWFYTLLVISTLAFGKAPFKNCIVLGHVNDDKGIKMSKHKGNVVDPWSILDVQGADAVRWYFYTGSSPWLPSRFSAKNVKEAQRKFMGTLWNTYAFFVLYADIDKYNPTKYSLSKCKLTLIDRWILSKLNTLVKFVDTGLKNYKITETARAIQDFCDELSNWYVRRSRERFWISDMSEDKIAAYTTLYTVLVTIAKISAPYVPFISEQIYQNLVVNFDKKEKESVHLCSFPKSYKKYIDLELEKNMKLVLDAVVLARAARAKSGIKNRQPISKMYISAVDVIDDIKFLEIIKGEINVKEIEYLDDISGYISYNIKPQLKTLGPKYGKYLSDIRKNLSEVDSNKILEDIKNTGSYKMLSSDNQTLTLSKEDLLIETASDGNYTVEQNNNTTVVLDIQLTEELLKEGFIREIISKIQTMRKNADFEVINHINVNFIAEDDVIKILKEYEENINDDTLCDKTLYNDNLDGYCEEWSINNKKVKIQIKRV